MDAGKFDPGLNCDAGARVGQQRPEPLSREEFLAGRRDVSPVQGGTGLHRAQRGVTVLFAGPAQDRACSAGKALGLAPLVTCHRHRRPLAQRVRRGHRVRRLPP